MKRHEQLINVGALLVLAVVTAACQGPATQPPRIGVIYVFHGGGEEHKRYSSEFKREAILRASEEERFHRKLDKMVNVFFLNQQCAHR